MKKVVEIASVIMLLMLGYACAKTKAQELTNTGTNAKAPGPQGLEISPGPMESERRQISNLIKQASARGVGISSYMAAMNRIEQMVQSGASEEQVKQPVTQLMNALSDQMRRADILKTQRPAPATTGYRSGNNQSDNSVVSHNGVPIGTRAQINQAINDAVRQHGADGDALRSIMSDRENINKAIEYLQQKR
jgi:hypothetical protein